MASFDNIISILITAKNEASAVLAKTATEARAATVQVNDFGKGTGMMAGASKEAEQSLSGLSGNLAIARQRLAEAEEKGAASESRMMSLRKSVGDYEEKLAAANKTSLDGSRILGELGNQAGISSQFLGIGPVGLATAVGVAAAALGGMAVKAAADFQQQLTKLATSAGESYQNLELVSDGIKKIAVETGASVNDLADGLYKIESAGFHGADGLNVLKASEQGAKAEGADLTLVADAVSSALIDYHLNASQSALVTSKLVAATSAGKMSFQELAGAMPAILPVASAAHVSLNDILGDMASMTVHGMSAQQSAENLADAIRHMQNPTAIQAKELALLGMTTTQLADDMKQHGLSGTIQEISQRIATMMPPGADKVILNLKTALDGLSPPVKELGAHLFDGTMSMKEYASAAASLDPISAKQAMSFATLAGTTHRIGDEQMTGAQVMQNYGQALAKAMGDSTGLNVALMLTGENAGTTNKAIKTVSDASVEAGNNVKGWSEIQRNFNQQMAQFGQAVQTTFLSVGQWFIKVWDAASKYLTPVFTMIGQAWNNYVLPIFKWISGGDGQKVVEYFGVLLAVSVGIAAAALAPLVIAVLATAAVFQRIVSVAVAVTQWFGENIPKAVQGVIGWWQRLVSDTKRHWDDFKNGIQKAWNDTGKAISDGINGAVKFISTLPERTAFYFGVFIGWLVRVATQDVPNFINGVGHWFQALPGNIGRALSDMWNTVVKWFTDTGNSAHKGAQDTVNNATSEMGRLPGQIGDIAKNMWNNAVAGFNTFMTNAGNWARDTINRIMDEFKKLPGQLSDAVSNAWNSATGSIGQWLASLGKNVQQGIASQLKGHALGTHFAPGGMTVVGENGPELVNLPTGSRVYNNKETNQMLGRGSGASVNIGQVNINSNMDEQKFLKNLGWRLSLA